MNPLSSELARQVTANPDAVYTVLITQKPDAEAADFADAQASIQPIAGLTGVFKASLTGHEILQLQHNGQIQAIEPDAPDFHALDAD